MKWWKEPTRDQWAAFTAAWAGWVLDAFDFTVFLLVMKQITEEFQVTYVATAGTIALTLLARLCGGVLAGWAADRWGRKLPLMISIVWFAACDGAVSFAPSFAWVLVLRTLFGFGMGAEWTAGSSLAMESWPARSRGLASGVLQGSWAVGYLLAAVAAAWVVPRWGWRALFQLAALPALLVLPIRFLVRESPDWKREAKVSWSQLVNSPGWRKNFAWATAMLAAGFCGYYALTGAYAPLLGKQFGFALPEVAFHVALFNVGMLVGAVCCGAWAARLSPPEQEDVGATAESGSFRAKWAIAVPAFLMALVAPLYVGAIPSLLALGAFLGGAFGGGHSGVTPLLLSSLFPAAIRARSMGLAYQLAAVPAAFVPMGIAALNTRGVSWSAGIAAVVVLSELLVVALILSAPRTLRIGLRGENAETVT